MKHQVLTFLDLPEQLCGFEKSPVVVLSIPYEATTTYLKGTKTGPAAIIAASSQVEFYDEELNLEPCRIGIATQQPLQNFEPKPEQAVQQISEACESLLNKNKFVVGLGGEHTVSVGLVRAHKQFYSELWVLQLDAHSDLRQSYEDSPFNHACTMARISELCTFVGVGIRSGISGERESLSPPSKLFYAHEMRQNPRWQDEALASLGDVIYITIDLDFFDPAAVPAVGTPEPGGFYWHETLDFLKKLVRSKRVVGFDVVELCPNPYSIVSDFFAAKLIYKLIGLIFESKLKNLSKKRLDS